jgi:hypothetical protein
MDLLCALPKAEASPKEEAVLAMPASFFGASAGEDEECALPCAALFGLDAFPSLDAFIDSADFDGARAGAGAAGRARGPRRGGGAAPGCLPVALRARGWEVPHADVLHRPAATRAALAGMECATDALMHDAWPPRCDVSEATVRAAPRDGEQGSHARPRREQAP